MAGMIPREFIDEVLAYTDIVELIDSRVPLKRSGNNHMACCPFHGEKTPSFSVNQTKQFYHCFGCGVSGDAIKFLMDYEHQSFVEAIEIQPEHTVSTLIQAEVIHQEILDLIQATMFI